MGKRGRPNAYAEKIEPKMADIITWAKAGATNKEIASALGISYSTFLDHISKNVNFSDSLKEARLSGVPEVKLALYKRAIGFEYEEKKVSLKKDEDGETRQYVETTKKYALPDVGAIQTYLRNYTPDFRDRDKFTCSIKEMELEIKKMLAEQNNF